MIIHVGEGATMLFVVFFQLLKLCGAIHKIDYTFTLNGFYILVWKSSSSVIYISLVPVRILKMQSLMPQLCFKSKITIIFEG